MIQGNEDFFSLSRFFFEYSNYFSLKLNKLRKFPICAIFYTREWLAYANIFWKANEQ